MKRPRGLRWRFLLGALASAAFAVLMFGIVTFTLVASDEEDEGSRRADGDSTVEEAGELVFESMLVATPVAAAAAFVIAMLLARRTTRPIDEAIEAARQITANDLSRRLAVPSDDGELRDLLIALNALFARLDEGFGALTRFAADASHELRTPLTIIATELDVGLRQERDNNAWQRSAAAILTETHRLSATVEGLLSLARAGADSPGTRQVVPILDIVDPIIAQLGAAADARGVTLVEPDAIAGTIEGNVANLETAIRNLLENALRHARSRVELHLARATDERTLRIIVDDDGPGLGDDPESLFLPLVRGEGAVRTTGAGLGLAIARRVAESHGGRLLPATSPAGGARMILTLPTVGAS